ncbi:hypothetical protein F4860DRAFT_469493 [Xylaria cubensis]|nr:hypothetical protein F4860DRAFT_469493 [Xylaria cubensis]
MNPSSHASLMRLNAFFLTCSALSDSMPLVLKISLLSIRLVADATTKGPQLELSSCCRLVLP